MLAVLLLSSFLRTAHADDLTVEELINQTPSFKALVKGIQDSAGVDCRTIQASPIGIAEADFEKSGQPTKFKFSVPCVIVGSSGTPPKILNVVYRVVGQGQDEVKQVYSEELVQPQQ